ncbi:MAG: hypothetical protein WED87_07825 [Dehalococcoidia bacterium]
MESADDLTDVPERVPWYSGVWVARAAIVGLMLLLAGAAFAVGSAMSSDGDGAGSGGQAAVVCQPGEPGCIYGEPIHEHADFALVINGEPWDFGQEKYISHDESHQLDANVHIHDPRHTVVHVHREHVSWDAFFRTLDFELNDTTLIGVEVPSLQLDTGQMLVDGEGGTFKFYVNGVRVAGIADLEIRSLQRVLISFGPESEDEAKAQLNLVTDEACIPAGRCPERGSGAGEHGEPCSGVGACTESR